MILSGTASDFAKVLTATQMRSLKSFWMRYLVSLKKVTVAVAAE